MARLIQHIEVRKLLDKFQSGYRLAHETETSLNDIHEAEGRGEVSVLVLLDRNAASHTNDHVTFLECL